MFCAAFGNIYYNIKSTYVFNPTIGLLEIYPTDTLTNFQNTGIMGFIVTFFVIAKQNKIGQPYEKIKTLQTI